MIYTIGHSDRSEDALLALLSAAHIRTLVDVRSHPASSRCPQFDQWVMRAWLGRAGVRYVHVPLLGGHRKGGHGIPAGLNAGWQNVSFRSYADYAMTRHFLAGLVMLEALSHHEPVAFCCAEAVPWRCHRSIIADWLVARGHVVRHLLTSRRATTHTPGRWGAKPRLERGAVPRGFPLVITYPPPQPALFEEVWEYARAA